MLHVKQFAARVPVAVFLPLRSKFKQLYSEGVEQVLNLLFRMIPISLR